MQSAPEEQIASVAKHAVTVVQDEAELKAIFGNLRLIQRLNAKFFGELVRKNQNCSRRILLA